MALTATAIELSQTSAVVPKGKVPKSKKGSKSLTALQEQEDNTLVQAAQAGYNSEIFSAAGVAYLQGGQQKMMEVVSDGMKSLIPGMTKVVGRNRTTEEHDAWDNVQTAKEPVDLWSM